MLPVGGDIGALAVEPPPSTAAEQCVSRVVELYSILQLYILYILYSSTASTLYSALHHPSVFCWASSIGDEHCVLNTRAL